MWKVEGARFILLETFRPPSQYIFVGMYSRIASLFICSGCKRLSKSAERGEMLLQSLPGVCMSLQVLFDVPEEVMLRQE